MQKNHLLILSFLVCQLSLSELQGATPYHPVHPDQILEPWRWQTFSELKGQGLRCMTQTTDGMMWFGIDAGIVCYDGMRWLTYTPTDGLMGAPVNVLCAARDGGLYAGTDSGISYFKNGVWKHVFPLNNLPAFPIDAIIETKNNNLWAATALGCTSRPF